MIKSKNLPSLSTRILIGFTVVILLTTLAIGIPAIWLVRNQLALRTWAQIEQAQKYRRLRHHLYNFAAPRAG